MPLVGYECEEHGYFDCFHNFVDEYVGICDKCGRTGRRVWEPAAFVIDFTPGFDVGLGEYVDTKKQRENIVAQNNLRRVKD